MKNLFDKESTAEITNRINALTPDTQRKWGTMNVSQMMAHCCVPLESAIGITHTPRLLAGRLIGSFIKKMFYGPKPFKKGIPTAPSFVVADTRDFQKEKENLLSLINKFHDGGETACTKQPHTFFGKLTPAQWAIGMYKHLDHHLRQFGV